LRLPRPVHASAWRLAVAAYLAGETAVPVGSAAIVGRPADLVTWFRDISPQVSKGPISAYNQSVVGALARLTTSHSDLSLRVGTGAWYLVAYAFWVAAAVALWRTRRNRRFDPLELGVLMLVMLLAGPLSWDHYFVWAVLPVVLLADPVRWEGRNRIETTGTVTALLAAVLLLQRGVRIPTRADVRADWWLRLTTDRYTLAALVLVVVSVWMLVRPVRRAGATAECGDGGAAAVGAPRPMVAAGVHGRG